MNRMLRLCVVSWLAIFGAAAFAAGQDTLASARQLYGSAAYDEALSMLDRLKTAPRPDAGDAVAVDQYRAFCLMALGRQADAVLAIESVVVADPSFLPGEADVSPRVLSAFRDARRRLVPAVAQQRYLGAKAAYDRKDYAPALAGFDSTLRLIDAPDLAEAGTQPPLSDLRTLVTGFRDLARAAAAPPPPPKVEPKPEPVAPAPPPPPRAFYTAEDRDVVPPTVIVQRIPPWPAAVAPSFVSRGRAGLLEVLITEQGTVESAVVRQSVARLYDDMLLSEAKSWRYKPATRNNVPVKFKKLIKVSLQ
jgi:tetratricopeptide (TPR) repeat protein